MVLNIKKIIKYSVIILLVLGWVYLIASYLYANDAHKKEVQSFCGQKCAYDSNSFMWEYAGEDATRGFTTKNECFSHCTKVKEGFAFYYLNQFSAGLMNSWPFGPPK